MELESPAPVMRSSPASLRWWLRALAIYAAGAAIPAALLVAAALLG